MFSSQPDAADVVPDDHELDLEKELEELFDNADEDFDPTGGR